MSNQANYDVFADRQFEGRDDEEQTEDNEDMNNIANGGQNMQNNYVSYDGGGPYDIVWEIADELR